MNFDRRRRNRAATDRFERQRAGAAEEVDDVFPANVLPEEVENRLANPLFHRTDATVAAVFELRSAEKTADDAQADRVAAVARFAPDVLIPLRTLARFRRLDRSRRRVRTGVFAVFVELAGFARRADVGRNFFAFFSALINIDVRIGVGDAATAPFLRFRGASLAAIILRALVHKVGRVEKIVGIVDGGALFFLRRSETAADFGARKVRSDRNVVVTVGKVFPIFAAALPRRRFFHGFFLFFRF